MHDASHGCILFLETCAPSYDSKVRRKSLMYLRCHVDGKVKLYSVYDLVEISSADIPNAWKFFS